METYIGGMVYDTLVNGVGSRLAIFFSGCNHGCKGCQNKHLWDKNVGEKMSTEKIKEIIHAEEELIQGVTFTGGDPFDQDYNLLLDLAKYIKEQGLTLWVYTGYDYDDLLIEYKGNKTFKELLEHIDIVVDGKFEESLYNPNLYYRGSSNQRLINLPKTLQENTIILWEE